jgi:hypothetical protein
VFVWEFYFGEFFFFFFRVGGVCIFNAETENTTVKGGSDAKASLFVVASCCKGHLHVNGTGVVVAGAPLHAWACCTNTAELRTPKHKTQRQSTPKPKYLCFGQLISQTVALCFSPKQKPTENCRQCWPHHMSTTGSCGSQGLRSTATEGKEEQ